MYVCMYKRMYVCLYQPQIPETVRNRAPQCVSPLWGAGAGLNVAHVCV